MKRSLVVLSVLLRTLAIYGQAPREGHASLSGTVVDPSGNSTNAEVLLYEVSIHGGFADAFPKCTSTTDRDGRYECGKLPAGKYLLKVLPATAKQKAKDRKDEDSLPYAFYPGVTDLEQAATIYLRDQEAGWADVRLPVTKTFSVSGTISPRTPEASFMLRSANGSLLLDSDVRFKYDGATGRFVATGVPAGHYTLSLDWMYADVEHRTSIPVALSDKPLRNLNLAATEMVEMTGQVINTSQGANPSEVELLRVDGTLLNVTAPIKDGSFQFQPVPAGDYVVRLPSSDRTYIDSIVVDGQSVEGSRLSAASPQTSTALNLKSPALSLQGTVKATDSIDSRAEVIAVSEKTGEVRAETTDKERRFSFGGLAPGTYRLFAWPGRDLVEYRNPRVLDRYKDDSTEVSIDSGNIASNLKLAPIQKLR